MNRRAFLSLLGRGAAVTAAGLVLPYEPQRVYSFLTNNPLAQKTIVTASVDKWGRMLVLDTPINWRAVILNQDFGRCIQITAD